MKWLERNWLKVVVTVLVLGISLVIIISIDAIIAEREYKAKIETLDIDIQRLRAENNMSNVIVDKLRASRAEEKAASAKEIADLKSNQKRELARIGREQEEERARVKELPPSVVVIEIRAALKTDEIWERPDGILFSLVAARDCLAILGDFSIAEERDQWKADYFKAMASIKDKDGIIATGDEIIIGIDDINFNLEEIIKDKDKQFNLSEKRNVQMYWKGIKAGGLALGIIGFIGGLVLGK